MPRSETSKRVNVRRIPGGREEWDEVIESSELRSKRHVVASEWELERVDCFCCTCDEPGPAFGLLTADPACRKHGYAARRPCDIHNMPGQPWDSQAPSVAGTMPESVLQHRAAQEEKTDDE